MLFKLIEVSEEIYSFLRMVIKFPLRGICRIKGEHNWKYCGGGFLLNPKYSFICKTCGARCISDLDEVEKHGINNPVDLN